MSRTRNQKTSTSRLFEPASLLESQQAKANKLMGYILDAETTEAFGLLRSDPSLLFIETSGCCNSTKTPDDKVHKSIFKGSPFQAMFLVGNIDLMKYVKTYVDQVPDGRVLAAEQLDVLDEHLKKVEDLQRKIDFGKLISVISKAEFGTDSMRYLDEQTKEQIAEWKQNVWKIIDVCKYLDFNLLITSLKKYTTTYHDWFVGVGEDLNWCPDARKNLLLLFHAFGYAQSFVPKWFAQALSQSFELVSEDKEQVNPEPDFKLHIGANKKFYHYNDTFSWGEYGEHTLGEHFYVDLNGGAKTGYIDKNYAEWAISHLSSYFSKHEEIWNELRDSFRPTTQLQLT